MNYNGPRHTSRTSSTVNPKFAFTRRARQGGTASSRTLPRINAPIPPHLSGNCSRSSSVYSPGNRRDFSTSPETEPKRSHFAPVESPSSYELSESDEEGNDPDEEDEEEVEEEDESRLIQQEQEADEQKILRLINEHAKLKATDASKLSEDSKKRLRTRVRSAAEMKRLAIKEYSEFLDPNHLSAKKTKVEDAIAQWKEHSATRGR